MPVIAPSILSSDICDLAGLLPSLERETEWLHFDVMDGIFVPNISFGFPVLRSLRPRTKMFFDSHLMIQRPEKYIGRFAEAGSDSVTFHAEACKRPLDAVREIHSLGKKAGIAVDHGTPVEIALPFLGLVDLVLVMGARAGFGGQRLLPENLEKVAALRKAIDSEGLQTLISIDCGVNGETASSALEAGADVLVMGSAVFKAEKPAEELKRLKAKLGLD